MESVHLILNYFFARTRFEKLWPSFFDGQRILTWSLEKAVVDRIWPMVNVPNRNTHDNNSQQNSPNPLHHNGALA